MMNVERIDGVRIRMPIIDQFSGLRNDIKLSVVQAIERTRHFIPIYESVIRIKNDPSQVIENHAHASWTFSPESILIKLNPDTPQREKFLTVELPRTVSHELHHAARLKKLPNENRSLGNVLIFEGLATIFETEVWGGELSDWANALSAEQQQILLPEILTQSEDVSYDHDRWFFGSKDLPKWAGYTMGVIIVKEYLRLHPNETAASLFQTPAEAIFRDVKQSFLNRQEDRQRLSP